MHWSLSLAAAPALEPISLDEAKVQLRLETNVDDTYVESLITAARMYIEQILGRAFITQDWDFTRDCFPPSNVIELPKAPLQSVTSVKYLDTAGVLQTMAAANYVVDIAAEPARISLAYGESWPSTIGMLNGVTIRFRAGYGDKAINVPQTIRLAIRRLVHHWYENREDVVFGDTPATIPKGLDALLWNERVFTYFQ